MATAPGSSAGPSGGSSRWYRPVYGFYPHAPALHHRLGAKILGGTMFFWIFYRAYNDGPVLLVSMFISCNLKKEQKDGDESFEYMLTLALCPCFTGMETPMGRSSRTQRSRP